MNDTVISVVVPIYNEENNIRPLFERIQKALIDLGKTFEIILVNDASTDGSGPLLEELQRSHRGVVVIHLFKRSGKAVALERGFDVIKGEYVVTIDADLQHDPEDIPQLIQKMEEGYDVVSGKRMDRHDSVGKIVTSRIFNILMRLVTGLRFDDYFSGLKCFRVNVIRFLALYGDLYRFAAVFAYKEGFRVIEIPTAHHKRASGKSKYSPLMRFNRAVQDLITVMFSITFSRKRVYYLGVLGLFLISVGLVLIMVAFYVWGIRAVAFEYVYGTYGIILIFLGLQAILIKSVADRFYERHFEEFQHRKRNVKSILGRE